MRVSTKVKSKPVRQLRIIVRALAATLLAAVVIPASAQAHGPVAPIASSYLARIGQTPAGLDAKVVDGDLRMWLRVPPEQTVVVVDYRGAPYLRFSPAGVYVNRNSAMYYLNATPFARSPPAGLTATTPPSWHQLSSGHTYEWHDGRLHALALVAIAPGSSFVGRWRVPLRVDGSLTSISGSLFYAPNPSIVWLWPVLVIVLCALAAFRVRSAALDRRVARGLLLAALLAIGIAGVAQELHGRPSVTVAELVEFGFTMALVAWGLWYVAFRKPGFFACLVVGLVAVWQGAELIPTLDHGFVLMAVPALLARTASVVCLGAGLGLLLFVFRLADRADQPESGGPTEPARENEGAWELA
jgi:hypothetical protein